MKKNYFFTVLLVALCLAVITSFTGCPDLLGNSDNDDNGDNKPYADFYNYAKGGRKDANGMLEIRSSVAAAVLLFTGEVSGPNYIGTIDGGIGSSIRVKLPEEKFYTIVAVEKAAYEASGLQAAQFSEITYYSNTQPYSIAVSASEMGGAGQWIITNNTDYWVSFRKADQSGTVYAVAAPKAARIVVPVAFNVSYDVVPHFYRQLKYNGKVVALVEFDDKSQANTIYTDTTNPNNRTIIGSDGLLPPSENIKPSVLFTNESDKNVRIYYGINQQLSNGTTPGTDFVVVSGRTEMFSDGLPDGGSTGSINFDSIAWNAPVYVDPEDNMIMQGNKVYHIVLKGSINTSYSTEVTEEDASKYFN